VGITIDHVGVPAADPQGAAAFLAYILGDGRITAAGPDGDMYNLAVGQRTLTYVCAPVHDGHHIAFRVDEAAFTSALERLRRRDVPFGNDPDEPTNGQTLDPLGGAGRVYFRDPNGHLFELALPAVPS
jgi:catechol 2,3-dioxygenase-like lactoylglutathione lyase family enzyme